MTKDKNIHLRDPFVHWTVIDDSENPGEYLGVVVVEGGSQGDVVALFSDSEYLRGVGDCLRNLADKIEDIRDLKELKPDFVIDESIDGLTAAHFLANLDQGVADKFQEFLVEQHPGE